MNLGLRLCKSMILNQSSFTSMKERDIRQSYVSFRQTQEGFHSERHETSHSMSENSEGFQSKGLFREYHIKFPVTTLLAHFKQIFNSKGFKTTEVFPGKIMLVKLTLIDRLKFILSSKSPCRYLLTVKTQQYKSVRKVSIRKLKDNPNLPNDKQFEQVRQLFAWIDKNPAKVPELRKDDISDNDFETSSEYQQDIYSLQATSTYMYDKIFVDRNYSMGRKMLKLTTKQSLSDQSTKQAFFVIGGLKEITQDMLKGFNCTRKQLLEILCHCRKTVEDYYHDRKFILKSKQKIQFERGSIETQTAQRIPQTVKSFLHMLELTNSQKIIRQIFLTHYIFELECQINLISQAERVSLGRKLGSKFSKQIRNQTRTLDLWGYSQTFYEQYLHDFIS